MSYEMVVLDVDGTLRDSRGEIRPAVRDAVREVVRRGVLVTLATGRRFDSASRIAAELGLELPLVLHGGALVQDSLTGAVLYEDALGPDAVGEIVGRVASSGAQPVLFPSPAVANTVLSGLPERDGPATARYLDRQLRVRRLGYDALARQERVIGVRVFEYEDVLRPLRDGLSGRCDCGVLLWDPPYTGFRGYLLEVVAPGCSKAKALAYLAARHGIPMERVMAVGDQLNDLEMLGAVGLGVAMGNAVPLVKERAGAVVATNDEDGVAEALRRFVLAGNSRRAPRDS